MDFKSMDTVGKIIFITSVFLIIAGLISLMLGGSALVALASVTELAEGDPAAIMKAAIAMLASGLISLLTGVFGIRAALNPRKILGYFIFACILMAISVVGLISALIRSEFTLGVLANLALSGIVFFSGLEVFVRERM